MHTTVVRIALADQGWNRRGAHFTPPTHHMRLFTGAFRGTGGNGVDGFGGGGGGGGGRGASDIRNSC